MKTYKEARKRWGGAAALMALLFPVTARAVPADSLRTYSLDEIEVLSAVKAHGTAASEPLSRSVACRATLDARHATSVKEASGGVPNLFIPDYGSRLTSAIYIRGVGSRAGTPAVGLYVDNVPYIDKSAFDFHFYDVERVEVLRGPQATVYGRNAMGGVINVYTRSPLAFQGTELSMGYATGDNHRTVALTHYHRPTARFAFSTGGYYEGGDGFFRNSATGKRVDDILSAGGRFRAIYAAPKLRLDLSGGYDFNNEGAYPYFFVGSADETEEQTMPHGEILAGRESRYRRSLLTVGLNAERRFDIWQLNGVVGWQLLHDRMAMDQDFITPDIYTLTQRQHSNTLSAELTAKSRRSPLHEWLTGVSLTAGWMRTIAPVTFERDGLDWLSSTINRFMPDISVIPMLSGMGFTGMGVALTGDSFTADGAFRTPTTSLALFHRSTLHLTPRLALTLGLRLDYEHDALRYEAATRPTYEFRMPNARMPQMSVTLPLASDISYLGNLSDNHVRLLPKAAATYNVSKTSTVYLSVSMGQRSGGYNVQMFSDILQGALRADMTQNVKSGLVGYLADLAQRVPQMPQTLPAAIEKLLGEKLPQLSWPATDGVAYRPERSWNYEAGVHFTTADGRLAIDGSLFVMNVSDQQISRFAPSGLGRMLVNAGKSRSLGGEAVVRYTPLTPLSLTASYGFTHATFTDYDAGLGADYTGCRVPFTPKHTMRLAADCRLAHAASWPSYIKEVSLGADVTAAGRVYFTEDNTLSQPFYATLGAYVSVATRDITLRLWGRNLTDARYNTFQFVSAGRTFEQHAKPLRVGIDITLRL